MMAAPVAFLLFAAVLSCQSSAPSTTSTPPPPTTTPLPTTGSAPTAGPGPSPTGSTRVRLSYEQPAPGFANTGDAVLRVGVVSADGGVVTSAPGRTSGDGQAVRFPTFDHTAPAPRAVVQVTNADANDHLNPGDARFEFGTDFVINATTADLDPASIDDGDNLVQRGRYDDVTQYKLEIDHGQAICRVKGRAGQVTLVGGTQLEADRWYRVRCGRDGTDVTVSVGSWTPDGSLTTQSYSKSGPTGDMATTPAVPLSLGGKLGENGVASDADQFNGLLDNTYLSVS